LLEKETETQKEKFWRISLCIVARKQTEKEKEKFCNQTKPYYQSQLMSEPRVCALSSINDDACIGENKWPLLPTTSNVNLGGACLYTFSSLHQFNLSSLTFNFRHNMA
jgi:hypothetical protein